MSAPWTKPKKPTGNKLSPAKKTEAKQWAKAHGKPYPSLIANMAVAKRKNRNG